MSDARARPEMRIESHRGTYTVRFEDIPFSSLVEAAIDRAHFIIDSRVAKFYKDRLAAVLSSSSVLLIEAAETSKSLGSLPAYVDHLVSRKVRRSEPLIAVGGGIIQDITAFLASTMLRGIPWEFYPTTLLAQADSCIGSKSSINCGGTKNILGTFCPPRRIAISTAVLRTLDPADIRSGVGEMLKAHAIAGPREFDRIAGDYRRVIEDSAIMERYIMRSLEIKKAFVEKDEFDTGSRAVMNYGHSFGHAIEAATEFAVPHGIAVTIGMDLANHVARSLGRLDSKDFSRMHPILRMNYQDYEDTTVPMDAFFMALGRDKKNVGARLALILPDASCRMEKVLLDDNIALRNCCQEFFESIRHQ